MRALIFDFDGLVVDTESIGYLTWKEIFETHGHPLSVAQYAQVVGTSFATAYDPRRDLERLTARSFDWDTLEAQRCLREQQLHHSLQTLPGVRERLAEAQSLGIRTAIASSSPRSWIHPWVERLGLGSAFEHISTVDDTGKVKPDPSLFLHAAEALGVPPEDTLIFEDSLNGLRAALAAQIRCLVVPGPMTKHLDFQGAWQQVDSLADVSLAQLQAHW